AGVGVLVDFGFDVALAAVGVCPRFFLYLLRKQGLGLLHREARYALQLFQLLLAHISQLKLQLFEPSLFGLQALLALFGSIELAVEVLLFLLYPPLLALHFGAPLAVLGLDLAPYLVRLVFGLEDYLFPLGFDLPQGHLGLVFGGLHPLVRQLSLPGGGCS